MTCLQKCKFFGLDIASSGKPENILLAVGFKTADVFFYQVEKFAYPLEQVGKYIYFSNKVTRFCIFSNKVYLVTCSLFHFTDGYDQKFNSEKMKRFQFLFFAFIKNGASFIAHCSL